MNFRRDVNGRLFPEDATHCSGVTDLKLVEDKWYWFCTANDRWRSIKTSPKTYVTPIVWSVPKPEKEMNNTSDGSTADYYELPKDCTELQDLISHRNMNAQIGEIFRACYRYGIVSHSDMLRDAKKMKFYADAEVKRLEKLTNE